MVIEQTTGLESKTSNPQTETLSDYSFEKHRKYIYNFVYRCTRDYHLSEDITQKTFLKAWCSRHKFDPEKAKVGSWLYIIAKNALIDHIRVSQVVLLPRCDEYAVYDITPDAELMENETATRVNAQVDLILNILDEHPSKYGTLLRYQFFQGLMGEEFAQVVGLHRGTVRWRIYRAKLLFREEWQKRFATPKGGTT